MEERKKKTNWIPLIGLVVIILLAVEDGMLILQNRKLEATLKSMTAPPIQPLKPAERVEPVKLQALEGNTIELNYADSSKRYLLFVLSTTCPHCEKTFPVWQSITSNIADNCNVIGIVLQNLEETKKYVSTKNVNFVTMSVSVDTSFSRKYRIAGVPETILMNGNGTVEKAWMGELSKEQAKEIETLVGASKSLTN